MFARSHILILYGVGDKRLQHEPVRHNAREKKDWI